MVKRGLRNNQLPSENLDPNFKHTLSDLSDDVYFRLVFRRVFPITDSGLWFPLAFIPGFILMCQICKTASCFQFHIVRIGLKRRRWQIITHSSAYLPSTITIYMESAIRRRKSLCANLLYRLLAKHRG